MFERFSERAHLVLDLARDEAEGLGQRYLGPEHVLLGLLREDTSAAARILRSHGMELESARAGLLGLAQQGLVPAPRPTDRDLLGTLGIDLDAIRRQTERTFGAQALGVATRQVTRRRWWQGKTVVWTPLCGPPLLAKRALHLASQQARALGHPQVGPEHLLFGVLDDAREPSVDGRSSRRHRRITSYLGLPDGYQGAAGALLRALDVGPDELRVAVTAELRGDRG
jgi:ATP-dependent Clp protease ATP-binding subunit ClpA